MASRDLACDFKVENVDFDHLRHEMHLDMRLYIRWNPLQDEPADWEPEWNAFNGERDMVVIDKPAKAEGKGGYKFGLNVRFAQAFRTPVDLHAFPFDRHPGVFLRTPQFCSSRRVDGLLRNIFRTEYFLLESIVNRAPLLLEGSFVMQLEGNDASTHDTPRRLIVLAVLLLR